MTAIFSQPLLCGGYRSICAATSGKVEMSFFPTAKKPGVSQIPIVPNEFGVRMVYGRCCTGYDGARQAGVSRHFCHTGNVWSPEFLISSCFSFHPDWKRNKGIPTAALRCIFLHCLGLAGKCLISQVSSHDLLPSTLYMEKTALM